MLEIGPKRKNLKRDFFLKFCFNWYINWIDPFLWLFVVTDFNKQKQASLAHFIRSKLD